MAFDDAPQGFFGPGYSVASNAITLNLSDASGVTTGTTFQGDATGGAAENLLTTASAHNLKVGDRVRVTEGTTLPSGLSESTDYWVASVPSSTTLTLAAVRGGAEVDLTTDGSADNTIQAYGPLEDVDGDDAHASTGDWRKVVFALMEMLYAKSLNTPTADQPTKVSIARSSQSFDSREELQRTYVVSITLDDNTGTVAAE